MYSAVPWVPWDPSKTPARLARSPIRKIGVSHPIRHPNSPTRVISLKGCAHQNPVPPPSKISKNLVVKLRFKAKEYQHRLQSTLADIKKSKHTIIENSPMPRLLAAVKPPGRLSATGRMPPMFNRNVFQDEYTPTDTEDHICEYKFCCEEGVNKLCNFCNGAHDDHHCGTILEPLLRMNVYLDKKICGVCGKELTWSHVHDYKPCLYCGMTSHCPAMCRSALYQGICMMVEQYKVVYHVENPLGELDDEMKEKVKKYNKEQRKKEKENRDNGEVDQWGNGA